MIVHSLNSGNNHHVIKAAFALAAAFLICSVSAWASPLDGDATIFWARVVHVADGDTIEVVRQGEQMEMLKIRLYGVDAPENGQARGKRAGQYLRKMIHKKIVTVEVKQKRDRYGRIVGIVKTENGQDVAKDLAKSGYVWVDPRFCKSSRVCRGYWVGVRRAQQTKAGLWRDKEPVPSWEWRR